MNAVMTLKRSDRGSDRNDRGGERGERRSREPRPMPASLGSAEAFERQPRFENVPLRDRRRS